MTCAPDPYATAGWTAQHQHRTSAEPPYLEPGQDQAPEPAAAEPEKPARKPRKRA